MVALVAQQGDQRGLADLQRRQPGGLQDRSAALGGLDREQELLEFERGRGDEGPTGLPRSRDFH